MLRRNGWVTKSVESVLRLEGSLWWEIFVKEVYRSWAGSERDRELWWDWQREDVVGAWTGRTETEGLEWGWRRVLGSWFQTQGEAYRKRRSVIRSENDVGGRARVARDEERVLRGRWTEMRLCRYACCVVAGTSYRPNWVTGVCIRWVQLFWASEESVRQEWYDRI